MTSLLGPVGRAWAARTSHAPPDLVRLVLADVDGVITRGEGQSVDLDVLERLAEVNAAARENDSTPAVTLCTGRQAPYVELLAQMVGAFLPCIFEHGCGLFAPESYRYAFEPALGPDYAARLASLRAALERPVLRAGRAFVQPGKEASMSLYPLGTTTVTELCDLVRPVVPAGWDVSPNVHGVEVRPLGIDKGTGAEWLASSVGLPLHQMAGVGDSDPDLAFLTRVGLSAAPANATPAVKAGVSWVVTYEYGRGLLEILTRLEARNRARLTDT